MGDLPQDYNAIKRELAQLKMALRDTSEHLGVVEGELHRTRLRHNATYAKLGFWRALTITVIPYTIIQTILVLWGII